MLKTIHSKLTLLHVMTFGLLLISVAVIIYFSFTHILSDFFDKNLLNGAKSLEYSIFHPPEKGFIKSRLRADYRGILSDKELETAERMIDKIEELGNRIDIQQRLNQRIERVFFFGPVFVQIQEIRSAKSESESIRIIARSADMKQKKLPLSEVSLNRILDGETIYDLVLWKPGERIRMISYEIRVQSGKRYILQFAMGSKSIRAMVRRLGFFYLFIVPFILLAFAVGGYFFVKRSFKPVRKIVSTVNQITSNDLSLRIEAINSKDEIGQLTETFNSMIGRLESSFNSIKAFSGNASHELKTPLTVLRGEIEVALRRERNPEEYQAVLKTLLEETLALQVMVDDLLLLSRLEGDPAAIQKSVISLDSLLIEVYEEKLQSASRKDIAIHLKRIETVPFTGNAVLLKRMLSNLIQNSIKYTGNGGSIGLSMYMETTGTHKTVRFTISDTGIGIEDKDVPYIFDSFFRVNHTREFDGNEGSGLGLAIVKRIVILHDGTVTVDSEPGIGSRFDIHFIPDQTLLDIS